MRVSTQQIHQSAVAAMLEQQARLSHTQQQVATGKQYLSPSENPLKATQAMQLQREIAVTEQHQSNIEAALSRQTGQEDVLAGVTEVLQRVSELLVQGNSDTLDAADRHALAEELYQRVDELLGLANARGANGEHLFSGFKGDTPPFSHDGHGAFTYQGDQGQRSIPIGAGLTVAMTDPGSDVFQRIAAGNGTFETSADPANTGSGAISAGEVVGAFVPDTYTLTFAQAAPGDPVTYEVLDGAGNPVAAGDYESGAAIELNGAQVRVSGAPADGDSFTIEPAGFQDVFSMVHHAAGVLAGAQDDPAARARLHTELDGSIAELAGALEHILQQRAKVGGRLNLLESQGGTNDAFLLTAREALSNAQDLDYAEATTRLEAQMVGLQAAQQSYIQIQGLSLFNYLR